MIIYRLFIALLALIIVVCLSGVQGQLEIYSSNLTSNAASQYTQYYAMPMGLPLSAHISPPVRIDIEGKTPNTLYFGPSQHEVLYSQYQSNASNVGENSLWLQGKTSWTQYAIVPAGALVSLISISTGGNGQLNETLPNGAIYTSNFYFFPYSQLAFYGESIGRHMVSYVIDGKLSNQVTIDVTDIIEPLYNYPPEYFSTP